MSYMLRGKPVLTVDDLKAAFGSRWNKNLPAPDAMVRGVPVWANAGDSLLKARAKGSGLWAQILIEVPEEALRRLRYATDAHASHVRGVESQAYIAWEAVTGPHRPTTREVIECLREALKEWNENVAWVGPGYDGTLTFQEAFVGGPINATSALFGIVNAIPPEETLHFITTLVEALRALNRK